MKKISILCMVIALVTVLATLCSCGESSTTNPPEAKTSDAAQTTGAAQDETPADLATYYNLEKDSYDGVDYYILKSVTEEGKKQKKLEVPKSVDGLEIKIIDPKAFEGCTLLEEVVFHSTVLELCKNLFPGCEKLKKIYLDFGELVQKDKAEEGYIANNTDVALASDGSVDGKNSFIEGVDTDNITLVFTDSEAYDLYRVEYRWGVFSGLMSLEK